MYRMLLAGIGLLFVLQSNPAFCACLSGNSEMDKKIQISDTVQKSKTASSQHSCCSKRPDQESESHSKESGADSCPLCQCELSMGEGWDKDPVLASSGTVSPEFILLSSMITAFAEDLPEEKEFFSLDPPGTKFRSNPIYIIHSSFLI